MQLLPAADQTWGHKSLAWKKGGDGCARPRAEGGQDQRGGRGGKGRERRGRVSPPQSEGNTDSVLGRVTVLTWWYVMWIA